MSSPLPEKHPETIMAILYLIQEIPAVNMTPFSEDNGEGGMQKGQRVHWKDYDDRLEDRPTTKELLKDEWFKEDREEESERESIRATICSKERKMEGHM